MLTYREFEDAVLFAIVEAEVYGAPAANSAGQIDVFEAVEQVGLERKESWIRDAVRNFENHGLVRNVVRSIRPPTITLMMTGEGHQEAERRRNSRTRR